MTAYRSLLERLKTLAEHLPPSHVVGDRPADRIVSALIHLTEFGDKILDAADDDAQHVADDLGRSPDQRSVAPNVVGVLCEPFPTPRSAEEATANQNEQIKLLQEQVNALLADRDNLPRETADGAPIPQTTVSTSEPELPSAPLTGGDVIASQEPGIPPNAPAPAPLQGDSPAPNLSPSVPDDAPAPSDPANN